jgi:hypothetical protein
MLEKKLAKMYTKCVKGMRGTITYGTRHKITFEVMSVLPPTNDSYSYRVNVKVIDCETRAYLKDENYRLIRDKDGNALYGEYVKSNKNYFSVTNVNRRIRYEVRDLVKEYASFFSIEKYLVECNNINWGDFK